MKSYVEEENPSKKKKDQSKVVEVERAHEPPRLFNPGLLLLLDYEHSHVVKEKKLPECFCQR